MNRMSLSGHLHLCKSEECTRRIQCNGETVCNTSGWLWWVGRRGLVWQSPSRRPPREPRSLSPPAVRNEFRKPLNASVEKRRGKRLKRRTNGLWNPSSQSLVRSITWFLLPAILSICASWLAQISNRPGAPLSCAIGRRSPRSNTEAHIFERRALSCSQPESPASARKRDG